MLLCLWDRSRACEPVPHAFGRDQKLIKCARSTWWFVGQSAADRRERNEDFVHVPTVVGGVLFLLGHDTDDQIWNSVQVDILANRVSTFGEELLGGVGPEKSHTAAFPLIVPVVEATRTH